MEKTFNPFSINSRSHPFPYFVYTSYWDNKRIEI